MERLRLYRGWGVWPGPKATCAPPVVLGMTGTERELRWLAPWFWTADNSPSTVVGFAMLETKGGSRRNDVNDGCMMFVSKEK